MAKDTIILGQMLALVNNELFDKLATQYRVNAGVRKMKARAHFAVMLYTQLTGLPSLRKAETATLNAVLVQIDMDRHDRLPARLPDTQERAQRRNHCSEAAGVHRHPLPH